MLYPEMLHRDIMAGLGMMVHPERMVALVRMGGEVEMEVTEVLVVMVVVAAMEV